MPPSSHPLHPILEQALQKAATTGLGHAGSVDPRDAWALAQAHAAVLIDVRSAEELNFVGQVPGVAHVAWANGTSLIRNPQFVRDLEAKTARNLPILLLCRSGKRRDVLGSRRL